MGKDRKSKVPETAEVPISSMIDVVFLLIIFFVVTAAIDKEIEDEKVILSQAPNGRPVKKKDPRSITINVRQDGTLGLGAHSHVTEADIINQLNIMKAQYGPQAIDIPIIVRGDYNAQHHHIQRTIDAIQKTELYKVRFNAQKED